MKSRWQKSLEAAVAAYDTPMPWTRGEIRNEMIERRNSKPNDNTHPAAKERRQA